MLVRAWRFVTLLFVALTLSMSFCHLLEMPVKMTLGWEDYATVQGIYTNFGGVGAFLETGAVLLTITLCFLVRRRRPGFLFSLVGALCLALGLAIWFAWVAPVNVVWAAAGEANPPADWLRLRSQWEYTHTARAILHLMALAAMQLSVILETPPDSLAHSAETSRRFARTETAQGR